MAAQLGFFWELVACCCLGVSSAARADCRCLPLSAAGPRRRGEGCDDEDQSIVAADGTRTGGAILRVTLLAAGFLIGE